MDYRGRIGWILCLGWLLCSGLVFAQSTSVDPKHVSFGASPDHALNRALDNQPIVTSYRLDVSILAGAFTKSIDLGKPIPDATGRINLLVADFALLAALDKNIAYTAVVVVVGPGGVSVPTAPSDPFGFAAPVTPRAAASKPVFGP